MQFQNPSILYFLGLILIPILVHLFQLQKFVKVPFTNVAFLQKIVLENRKSSRIKKWLVLATRTLLLFAIVFAFSQPYFSNKKTNIKQHNFIYLDNSLSTNSDGEKGNLLKNAAQEIIENASKEDSYSLQTNDKFLKEITYSELKKNLLNIQNTSKKISFSNILLKLSSLTKNKTNTLNKNILISDFQSIYKNKFTNVTPSFSVVKLNSSTKNNISIDSVFIDNGNINKINILIKNQGEAKNNIPIALFNDEKLISKQSFSIKSNTEKTIAFTIQKQTKFLGKLNLSFSDTFSFDNTFFFNLNSTKKTPVLSIGNPTNFMPKIYSKDEFIFTQSSLQNVNYNAIQKQQLIILNELDKIPAILINSLTEFSKNGGNIVIIPNIKSDVTSYNNFLGKIANAKMQYKINDSLKVTSINFNHPLFKDVFSKEVTNFQYPNTLSYYPILSKNSSKVISFENNASFLSKIKAFNNNIYFFSSAINKKNSNFLNSPLIVPVFYNFGKLSFKHPKLYYFLDEENKIDFEVKLKKDEILKISNPNFTFIPQQQTFQNKVRISTKEQPIEAGFYSILSKNDTLQTITYNNPKSESLLSFIDLNQLIKENKNAQVFESISDVFSDLNEKNKVHWLWKWFLALAIVSLLLEILILKFYKP